MTPHKRLAVLNAVVDTGLVPVFYHPDAHIAIKVVAACVAGGARVVEFTNRGDFAPHVFAEVSQHFAKADPAVMLGVGIHPGCTDGRTLPCLRCVVRRRADAEPRSRAAVQPA